MGTRAPGPPGLEAKLLHQHICGCSQEHPQLIGQETRATGAVDVKAELEFLKPVLSVAAGAVDDLVDVPRRGLQIGDHKTRVVLGFAARTGGHFRLDDHPVITRPTPGLIGTLALSATGLLPFIEVRPHLGHQGLGQGRQPGVLLLEELVQLRSGKARAKADAKPCPGERPA